MHSTNTTIEGCGFHHVAIRVSDWDKSIRFYCKGLGFGVKLEWGEAPTRAAMLDTGDGNYLEIFERENAPVSAGTGEPNILHFCFRARDCAAAIEKVRAAGGEITMEPKQPETFEQIGLKAIIAFAKGPNGEVIELFQSDAL